MDFRAQKNNGICMKHIPPTLIKLEQLHCLECGGFLGETTASVLVLAGVVVRQRVAFECGACGQRRIWQPLREQKQKED